MAGYVMADVEVTDPKLFSDYQKLVAPTVEQYGGRYLVRGGNTEVVEGEFEPNRTVVIEFDSFERAREWYNSPEYAEPKRMRIACTNSNVLIVEGA